MPGRPELGAEFVLAILEILQIDWTLTIVSVDTHCAGYSAASAVFRADSNFILFSANTSP
ncbi:hypothetical protein RRSWK_04363 [Rhodopirellula sp. SWK7]|nr:hypothetical protein RRSWK_04363 [Rhodopirellula sp. SWK7]